MATLICRCTGITSPLMQNYAETITEQLKQECFVIKKGVCVYCILCKIQSPSSVNPVPL